MSSETGIKASGEASILWKATVGLGNSAFVVADGRAFTLGHNGTDQDTLWCFDAESGEVLWKKAYPQPLGDLYYPGGTTGTPTVEGEFVYSLARQGELFCLKASSGEVVWQTHLQKDHGAEMPDWGFTGAPLPFGDLLLVNAGDAGMALDKKSGKAVWRSEKGEAGYSTPFLFERGGKDLAIFTNKDGYTCVDAATGHPLWFVKHKTRYGVNAAEPVISGDRVFISSGYGKGAALLEWSGTGEPGELWRSRDMKNQMNPSLLVDGHLYGIDGNEGQDRTGLKCMELESGETRWLEESIGHGAITAADGKLIVLSEQGELLIAPISPEGFAPTLRAKVLGAKCWTVPVLANGRLYCRNSVGEVAVVDLR